MTVWRFAFRRWAEAFFGDRWLNRDVDSAWVDAYKIGFRAGWRAAQRPVCDPSVGEWRCRCPSDPKFDTSINPRFVKACARCGAERPAVLRNGDAPDE